MLLEMDIMVDLGIEVSMLAEACFITNIQEVFHLVLVILRVMVEDK